MERMFSVQFWSILETCRKLLRVDHAHVILHSEYLAFYTRVNDVLRVILGYKLCQLFCLFMYSVN